ncbi:trehalose-6-phosphate synthase [Lacisediminimonas sp.]|uniref:alpha,alpha-trehalose-phosphate synthase (UDP-forming) n=1 Tax=Lacisediminimonas sp. TaxID=3060582 RepID=UPI00271D1588|nr:trehalose-6-phosphate synthase [Lacisediminimonas sp.]MDO8299749.1 trehalose-6-phosphate synthase [Lacisediminimonas sp.]
MQSFRFSLRFILPLALVVGLFAYAVMPVVNDMTVRWFVRDLEARSQMLASALQQPLLEYVADKNQKKIRQLFDRSVQEGGLYALGFCSPSGQLLYRSSTYPVVLGCRAGGAGSETQRSLVDLPDGRVHVTESQVRQGTEVLGQLILVHDMRYIERRTAETQHYLITLFALLAVVISLITVFIAHLSWRGWINAVKGILHLDERSSRSLSAPPEVQPLVGDLRALLHEMRVDRRGEGVSAINWTPEKLRSLLHDELSGDQILVVSNREPYIHTRTPEGIEVRRPASGLVTAVEPVMRACSGTWIAHGAGTADRETVDANDHVAVPPRKPSYTLRRVWLSKEEEQGYYYGFANEGLWPLCHIAHVRPVFRTSDWEQYVAVNQRFADAVIKEAHSEDPVVLVQDYHFALLPRMVREKLPRATIIMFWHIPWPNPESFGICPWREEILEGLLGNTLLGFHTPFHCKNFLETVDRYLEARIEHEASTISYGGELTEVEPYPISIAWPDEFPRSVPDCRADVRRELGLSDKHLLALGVDRLDYTKGIIERIQAVERVLELYPSLIGHFSLVQIAAPSRSSLDEYQNLESRVRALALRINKRFSNGSYEPIILKIEHYDSEDVNRYYRGADVCMVTSLHDGMNLVAKEFVAARDDERGVLILSQFTGAARELHEALIINPYHIEQGAEALHRALTMPEGEQRERMRSMRILVRDFNVYRWAGRMLIDAARLRRRERVTARIHSQSRKALRRVV